MSTLNQKTSGIAPIAIHLKNVSKTHQMVFRSGSRLGAFLYGHVQSRKNERNFQAIHDLSLEIPKGRFTVIVGENGAGKSTLLRAISGITPLESGSIEVNGKISSMLELGFGFHPELNGYENCYLQGAILGLNRKQIEEKLPEIIDFAEIHRAMDQPVRFYSAGMFARLAFSLSIHTRPEIILIDEILAVGDPEFQHKSFNRILQLRDEGATILIVSHNLSTINVIADDAIWLRKGRLQEYGQAKEVIGNYLKWSNHSYYFGTNSDDQEHTDVRYLNQFQELKEKVKSEFKGEVSRIEMLEKDQNPTGQPISTEPLIVRGHFNTEKIPEQICVKCLILRRDGIKVTESSEKIDQIGKGFIDFKFQRLPLVLGEYEIHLGIYFPNLTGKDILLAGNKLDFSMSEMDYEDKSLSFFAEGTCRQIK